MISWLVCFILSGLTSRFAQGSDRRRQGIWIPLWPISAGALDYHLKVSLSLRFVISFLLDGFWLWYPVIMELNEPPCLLWVEALKSINNTENACDCWINLKLAGMACTRPCYYPQRAKWYWLINKCKCTKLILWYKPRHAFMKRCFGTNEFTMLKMKLVRYYTINKHW